MRRRRDEFAVTIWIQSAPIGLAAMDVADRLEQLTAEVEQAIWAASDAGTPPEFDGFPMGSGFGVSSVAAGVWSNESGPMGRARVVVLFWMHLGES